MENTTKAIALKLALDNLRPINKEQEDRIMQKFRLDWNYHSNHLEGNTLTYGETKALVLFGITAQGKPLKDHFEITGHNEAINWVIDVVKGDHPLTERFIRELHTLLLKESYEVDAITADGKPTKKRIAVGSYKTSANHVKTKTGEIFYFATPEETPAKMHDLLVWYNEKINEDFNPILLAAEFHYRFIRIHPFDDGNGRTARILMNFILMKFGYPPTIIKTEDKGNYFAVLQMADAGNIEAFLEYIAQNLVRSLEIMIAGANGENIEEDDDLDKEIALLEQKLSKFGDKAKRIKNREDIKDLLVIDVDNIINKIKLKTAVLSKMYIENHLDVKVNYQLSKRDYDYNEEKREIFLKNKILDSDSSFNKYEISRISIDLEYENFNRINLYPFDYRASIDIRLWDKLKYQFLLTSNYHQDFKILQKPYGERLTDSEIEKIVKTLVKIHKIFIEHKIGEKEKKL